jgi:hypothetical protein
MRRYADFWAVTPDELGLTPDVVLARLDELAQAFPAE